jgi:ubiquinone/menaquinone biosynthesis C-methylase UbiE
MGLYAKYILPTLIDWTCKQGPNQKQREKVVPTATGKVLEIGIGSGLNLPFYNPKEISSLTAIDPSISMWKKNDIPVENLPFKFDFLEAYAEDIPVGSNNFDTVLVTYTLCSIPEIDKAFSEIRRVLKPTGKLVFCEHGKAPDKNIEKWQRRMNPLWKRLGGGCNLHRDIPKLLTQNGFQIKEMEAMYIPGWKPASYNYWGNAVLR